MSCVLLIRRRVQRTCYYVMFLGKMTVFTVRLIMRAEKVKVNPDVTQNEAKSSLLWMIQQVSSCSSHSGTFLMLYINALLVVYHPIEWSFDLFRSKRGQDTSPPPDQDADSSNDSSDAVEYS